MHNFNLISIIIYVFVYVYRMIQPFFINGLLKYFSPDKSTDTNLTQTYWYATGLVLSMLISVIMYHSIQIEILQIGMKMRIACCSAIYQKVTIYIILYLWFGVRKATSKIKIVRKCHIYIRSLKKKHYKNFGFYIGIFGKLMPKFVFHCDQMQNLTILKLITFIFLFEWLLQFYVLCWMNTLISICIILYLCSRFLLLYNKIQKSW